MAPVFPSGVTVQGNVAVVFVPTLADPAAPDLSSEINGASALDVSCYLIEGGWAPSVEASRVTPTRRLCSKKDYEAFGITTESLGDLRYTISPQAAAGSPGKDAYEPAGRGVGGRPVRELHPGGPRPADDPR